MSNTPLAPVGGLVLAGEPVIFNRGKTAVTLKVRNTGDRPVQIGSHFHFFEANRALSFDRAAAYGMHLDIAASTALRFEPGDERTVALVPFGGLRRVCGFNNLVDGDTAAAGAGKDDALKRALDRGFKST
jgi:urease subunit beta